MNPSRPPINANTLAKALEVPADRITAIIKGQRGAIQDIALHLEYNWYRDRGVGARWQFVRPNRARRLGLRALNDGVERRCHLQRGHGVRYGSSVRSDCLPPCGARCSLPR